MYPSSKGMDAVHSGTGVFYQAMPAVGADGKNIMKLIPVQMIDGQFFQTTSKPKTDFTPQRALTVNIPSAPVQVVKKASLSPSATQQAVRKPVSLANTLHSQVGLDRRNSLNKRPPQEQKLKAKVPSMVTHTTNCERLAKLPSQLPVTVKSPALPRGQYLQIPHNAQVRTVQASELPAGIKKQIFTSSASSSPGSSLPSVIYVSPITTVNQDVTPPRDPSLRSLNLSKTTNRPESGPTQKASTPHLKLIPKVSQRPNSPIKWVIEEEESSRPPTVDPPNSPSVTSEILSVVAERENALKRCDANTKPVSQLSPGKSDQGQENALVMCNGKVFFVAKKCSLPRKMGKGNSPNTATKSEEVEKNTVPPSKQPHESAAPEMKQDLRIISLDESDEVIDLCDDDTEDDSSQQVASVNLSAVTQLDEDNVIFVSYIPPKPEAQSAQDVRVKTQMAPVRETDQMVTGSSNTATEPKSLDGAAGQSTLVSTVNNVTRDCGSTVMSMHGSKDSNINGQQSTSIHQLESREVHVETGKPVDACTSDSRTRIFVQTGKETNRTESSVSAATRPTSSLSPKSCAAADHLLRQMFQIKADVRICLRRIDEASPASVSHPETDRGLVEQAKELAEQEGSTDSASATLCSHLKLNTKPLPALKCISGQSSCMGMSYDVESEPVIGYVEPIDEDFLSTDENDIPRSQDVDFQRQTPTCVDLNSSTRRMGRMRKRTICPCCIPGSQDPAAKYAAKSWALEKFAWATEQASKKGGKTKAVRKNGITAKNKQNSSTPEFPASDSSSTTSMDSDELKRHEQIHRLRELLREKEAALEVMRNSMS